MRADFYDALLAEPATVLGRRLRPLCVGHVALLEAIESPLITGKPCYLADLLIAVGICERTFEDGAVWLRTLDRQSREFKKWGKKINPLTYQEAMTVFDDYLSSGHKTPPLKKESTQASKFPNTLCLASGLMRYCRFTESQAWNTGFALASWYLLAAAGADDAVQSDNEQKVREYLKRQSMQPVGVN
jgi:hypothetical protein